MVSKVSHTAPEIKRKLFIMISNKNYSQYYQYYFRIRFTALEIYMAKNYFSEYSPEIGKQFIVDFTYHKDVGKTTIQGLKTFINKVNDVYHGEEFQLRHSKCPQAVPVGFTKVLDDYTSYCFRNGNKKSTVDIITRNCRIFCCRLNELGCSIPIKINDSVISTVCLKTTNKDSWRFIRAFLTYMYDNNYTEHDYSYLVPKAVKSSILPSVYSTEEVLRIETAVNTSTITGKRDLCIILLASRLAMRSGDIVKLKFDEIDWKNERITFIQEKTGQYQSLPLLTEIKEALTDYLNNSRPKSDMNNVFLGLYAPFRPLTTSVTRRITKRYMDISGVEPEGRRHGSHIFRSSAATSMVNDGISYEIVRSILGHTDPNDIQYYAALDLKNLRHCALSVPEPSGFLKDVLEGKATI